jgi:hypothetical protein
MEVHAHTHTARKKWTHYFWEFLMLFLAVFCGFLAEYQLEHTIEHQREKSYAFTLYEDLKADTATLKDAIRTIQFVTEKIDTFRFLVQTKEFNEIPSGNWYYFGRFGTRYFNVVLQDATLEQLKSSGGLRYFKKANVVNAIARYDQACRNLHNTMALQTVTYDELIACRNEVFNVWYMDILMEFDSSRLDIDSFKRQNPPLLSNDKKDFIKYANFCQIRSSDNKYFVQLE